MLLSEPVHCVPLTLKMTDGVEQQICITFVLRLNIAPWSLFGWFRRLQLWATGDWQLRRDNAPALAPYLILRLLAFPKTKITFDSRLLIRFRKIHGTADGNWETCVRSQGAYFEGDWGIIILCTMFFVSCVFFSKCLYFSYYISEYLLDNLI